MAENDPHPGIRHKMVRLLIENPPFERAHKHRLDKPDLVHRIWSLIKYVFKLFCKKFLLLVHFIKFFFAPTIFANYLSTLQL